MRIELPILSQRLDGDTVVSEEKSVVFDLDTSVYSEERWEQNFPALAAHEGLFQYIERINEGAVTDRVRVACMLKAVFCFIESREVPNYKAFAQMFNLAVPEYTERLIATLHSAFKAVLGGSSVKN